MASPHAVHRMTPPPHLGQYTDEILAELDYSPAEALSLRQTGAVDALRRCRRRTGFSDRIRWLRARDVPCLKAEGSSTLRGEVWADWRAADYGNRILPSLIICKVSTYSLCSCFSTLSLKESTLSLSHTGTWH